MTGLGLGQSPLGSLSAVFHLGGRLANLLVGLLKQLRQ